MEFCEVCCVRWWCIRNAGIDLQSTSTREAGETWRGMGRREGGEGRAHSTQCSTPGFRLCKVPGNEEKQCELSFYAHNSSCTVYVKALISLLFLSLMSSDPCSGHVIAHFLLSRVYSHICSLFLTLCKPCPRSPRFDYT